MYICELVSVYLYTDLCFKVAYVCWSMCTCVYTVVVGNLVCLHMHFLVGMPLPRVSVCVHVLELVFLSLCVSHVNMFRFGYLGTILMQE